MVVSATDVWGSIGGGNLEAVAIDRARAGESGLHTVDLSDKAPYEHGVQCCGGEVTLLLEPFGVDVCSKLRTDGKLDEQKLAAFVRAIGVTIVETMSS